MAKQGAGTMGAPTGGHGKSGKDISLGSAGATKAAYNGGSFPVAPTPGGGHGTGSGYKPRAIKPSRGGGR